MKKKNYGNKMYFIIIGAIILIIIGMMFIKKEKSSMPSVDENKYCYQARADTATACGGLANSVDAYKTLTAEEGFYSNIDSPYYANFKDGNWDTFIQSPSFMDDADFYIHYLLPSGIQSSNFWKVKDACGIKYLDINDCLDYAKRKNKISLHILVSSPQIEEQCLKSDGQWITIGICRVVDDRGKETGRYLYEEAMLWDIG